jgi:RHS repeat-associated protein
VTEYLWDYRNRLTGVLFKDGAGVVTRTIEYSYDVNDRRIGKRIDGVTMERYVYDGSDVALVFDGAGVQTHRYLHGTGVDTVLADETPTRVVLALADNQGTVRDVLDGNGVVLNHVSYDSFGKVVGQSNVNVEFRYGFTGRETDGETGLDYYRARYYDSANGRFISEDPLGFGAGDANLTRYVGNSPTNFTDPSGKCPLVLIPLAAAGITGTDLLIGLATGAGLIGTGLQLRDLLDRAVDPNFDLSPSPPPFPAPHNPLHLDDYRPEIFSSHPGDLLPPLGGIDLTPVWTNHHTGSTTPGENHFIPVLNINHGDEVFYDIGYGHASSQERMAEWAQIGIHNQQQLTEHLQNIATFPNAQKNQILNEDQVKEIYLGNDGTILIINPQDPDKGTAFNPNIQQGNSSGSREYFDLQPGIIQK